MKIRNIMRTYVIEGLDGVGKSTSAKRLADKLRANYIATPLPELRPMKSIFDSYFNNIGRFFYYLLGNYHFSEKVCEGYIELPIVVDRYIASTIAYHNALLNKDTSQYVDWNKLFVPEINFYLVADQEVRSERIKKRKNNSKTDGILERNISLAQSIEKEYDLLTKDYLRIDTTRLKQDEVVDIMYKEIMGGN